VFAQAEYKDGRFYIPDVYLEDFLSRLSKIQVKSIESRVYKFKSTGDTLFKIPKKSIYHDNAVRAYYIGREVNKVPNFIKTLGMYSTQCNQVMIAYEYIEGSSLDMILPVLSFREYLDVFLQILMALQTAQKSCCFTHYDLHLGNVLMKKGSGSGTYTPVIIDFGLATAKIKNKTIGSYEYSKYGISSKMYTGVDMYKFLFHSVQQAQGELEKQIRTLFRFYVDDPYNVINADKKTLGEISKNYLKNIYKCEVAECIPLDLIHWINEKY
jgi:serine/threonine protein kinase